MYNEDILKAVRIEDLPPEYMGVYERILKLGIQPRTATLICLDVGLECGGLCYPLRKIDSAYNIARKRLAQQALDSGKTYREIARKFFISEQAVRDFHKEQCRQKRAEGKKT